MKSLLLLQFPIDSFETMCIILWISLHIIFFSIFLNLYSLILGEFSSNFHSNRYCSYTIFKLIPLILGTEIR